MEKINAIAKELKKGKVIVCPTDTLYGLIVDATNKKAVDKVFKIKKRPKSKAIAVFIKNIKEAKRLAFVDREQEEFLKKVWPGKLTVILKRKQNCDLAKNLFAGKKVIGLRVSSSKLVNQLVKEINRPLTTTSANISGKPGSTRIKDVLEQFRGQKLQPDLIINVGNLPKSKPSAVIDLTIFPPKVLRK